MYNKGQTKVLFILINSIIDTTAILLLYYCYTTAGIPYGNQLATIRQPKINHYTTYQDFNNKNISIIKAMYTTLLNNKAGTNERKRL